MSNSKEVSVDVKKWIVNRRRGYKTNIIIGIIFCWFFPVAEIVLYNAYRFNKKTDQELFEVLKKIEDRKAAKKGYTVKYINTP